MTETAKVMANKETGKCAPFKGKIIMIYIIHCNTICYSSSKKSKFLSFSGQWIELESSVLSETSQALKAKYHLFSLSCRVQTLKSEKYLNAEKRGSFGKRKGIHKGRKE